MGKHTISAIIYDKRNRIISMGQNSYVVSHPFMAKCSKAVGEPEKIYLHAEVAALVKLKDWTKAHKIVITRFTKDGKPANAMPCKACQHALKLAGITNIMHT